jgi:hypothetical protein
MSAYKKLNKQDAYITTYTARKHWAISGSDYVSNGVKRLVGESGSGAYYLQQDDIESISYTRLIFNSINHLYYSLFSSGSVMTTGSYENYLQSSFSSGSRNIYEKIGVYSLPRNVVGTHIEPLSLSITPEGSTATTNYVSGGYSNELSQDDYIEDFNHIYGSIPYTADMLIDYITVEGDYVDESIPAGGQYLDIVRKYISTIVDDGEGNLYLKYSSPRKYVGNVIYPHGQIVLTDENVATYLTAFLSGTLDYKSNHPIYTHNYHCRVRESEFNYTYNPSALTSSLKTTYYNDGEIYISSSNYTNGTLNNNITGSEFQPYITTVGLYNDANELIAVGKLGQPIPKSANTDMTFIVKIDI